MPQQFSSFNSNPNKEFIHLIEMICSNGLNFAKKYKDLTFDELFNFIRNNHSDFMNNCFDGWKKAQDIILLKQLSFWKNNPKFTGILFDLTKVLNSYFTLIHNCPNI